MLYANMSLTNHTSVVCITRNRAERARTIRNRP